MSITMRHYGLLGACAAAAALTGCSARREEARAAPRPSAPEVEYVTVRSSTTPSVIELPGAVVATSTVRLTAPCEGQVRALAEEGAQLPRGGEAAVLDATGLRAQVGVDQAASDAAERRHASAETAVRQAEKEVELAVATLEQTLKAVEAERDRRRALLAQAGVQAATEPARLRAQLRAAEARLRRIRAGEREPRIRQLEADLQVIQSELSVTQVQLKRKEALYAKGFISTSDWEESRLNVERARANEVKYQEQLRLVKEGAHPEEIKEAEEQVEVAQQAVRAGDGLAQQVAERRADLAAAEAESVKARHNLQRARTNRLAITRAQQDTEAAAAEARRWRAEFTEARARLARATVRVPFAGQVVRRHTRPGETVTAGAPLLEVVDMRRLQFQASISETDVARLRRGDRLLVTVPAAAPRSLAGRVVEVILAAEPMKRAYTVKVAIEPVSDLRPGMAGTARLMVRPSETRPHLPMTCFTRYFPQEHRAEILLLEGDRPVRRQVRLGTQTGSRLAIEEGLKEGDRVIVSDTNGLAATASVRGREVGAS